MHSEICPICNGKGKIPLFDGYMKNQDYDYNVDIPEKTCHGCDGQGWIQVRDEPMVFPAFPHADDSLDKDH